MTSFIHTADWQLGKPFSRVTDPDRQAALRGQRLETIDRIAAVAKDHHASFVVVAGDVFDSHRPPDRLISKALQRIGQIGLPVYVIPGNHDYGGPGSLWLTDHFQRENRELAPNLIVLGGGVMRDNGSFLKLIREETLSRAFPLFCPTLRFELSRLGEDVVCRGAALYALQKLGQLEDFSNI